MGLIIGFISMLLLPFFVAAQNPNPTQKGSGYGHGRAEQPSPFGIASFAGVPVISAETTKNNLRRQLSEHGIVDAVANVLVEWAAEDSSTNPRDPVC